MKATISTSNAVLAELAIQPRLSNRTFGGLTDETARNLEQIDDYIAQDNPKRALTFVREPREKRKGIQPHHPLTPPPPRPLPLLPDEPDP